jgi:hypothetical protein
MCNKYVCWTISAVTVPFAIVAPPLFVFTALFGGMGTLTAAIDASENHESKVSRLENNWALWDLSSHYQRGEFLTADAIPDESQVFKELKLPWGYKGLVKSAQTTRDKILFGEIPPNARSAGAYVQAQKGLDRLNHKLVYALDPQLLSASLDRSLDLVMSSDLSSCRDGTYRTSVEFVAGYRNIVGEEVFQKRMEWYQKEHRTAGQPWYFGRPDYQSRLEHAVGGDSF